MRELIEPGIRSLVDALNALGFVSTVYSCEGHFGHGQNEMFLPTAYVTFSMSDHTQFARLYDTLSALSKSLEEGAVKLTYDCLLGRYTLSVWPDVSARTESEKRSCADALIGRIADAVAGWVESRSEQDAVGTREAEGGAFPCDYAIPPCALVIPCKTVACPFAASTGEEHIIPGT